MATFNPVPSSMISAQNEYTGLAKAMRQCYPPDGCPAVKGDFDDLTTRLAAAASSLGAPPPDYSKMPQPKSVDAGQSFFVATAPLDAVAQATGAQKGGPLPPAPGGLSWLAWIQAHKTALIVGGVAIVGVPLLLYGSTLLSGLMMPFKAVKGIAALAA